MVVSELNMIDWEAENKVLIGEKLHPDPQDTEPDSRWVFVRGRVSKIVRKKV